MSWRVELRKREKVFIRYVMFQVVGFDLAGPTPFSQVVRKAGKEFQTRDWPKLDLWSG